MSLSRFARNWVLQSSRLAWVYPLCYMLILFGLSSVPDVPENTTMAGDLIKWTPPDVQNLLHVPVYGVLAALWCRSLRATSLKASLVATLAFSLSALYGVFDEWYQSLVPGRFPTSTDALLNVAGAALGTWLYLHFARPRTRA